MEPYIGSHPNSLIMFGMFTGVFAVGVFAAAACIVQGGSRLRNLRSLVRAGGGGSTWSNSLRWKWNDNRKHTRLMGEDPVESGAMNPAELRKERMEALAAAAEKLAESAEKLAASVASAAGLAQQVDERTSAAAAAVAAAEAAAEAAAAAVETAKKLAGSEAAAADLQAKAVIDTEAGTVRRSIGLPKKARAASDGGGPYARIGPQASNRASKQDRR